jgi:hypothetical protein
MVQSGLKEWTLKHDSINWSVNLDNWVFDLFTANRQRKAGFQPDSLCGTKGHQCCAVLACLPQLIWTRNLRCLQVREARATTPSHQDGSGEGQPPGLLVFWLESLLSFYHCRTEDETASEEQPQRFKPDLKFMKRERDFPAGCKRRSF